MPLHGRTVRDPALCWIVLLLGIGVPTLADGQETLPTGPASEIYHHAPIAPPDTRENLTLDEALVLAEQFHPSLRAAAAEVEAARGRQVQAGLYPNPQFSVGTEAAPFNGGPGKGEDFIKLSQPVVAGNRRQAALAETARQIEAAQAGYETARQQLHRDVRLAYYTLVYAQHGLVTLTSQVKATEELVQVTRSMRDLKEASERDVVQAEVDLANVGVRVAQWQRSLEVARAGLAGAMGQPGLRIVSCAGALPFPPALPRYDALESRLLLGHPELAVQDWRVAAQQASVSRIAAERVPDVTASLGYRYLGEQATNSYDLQLSVPLPVWDRNQGRLREAQANTMRAVAERESTRVTLVTALRAAYADLASCRDQALRYRDEIISRSTKSLEFTRRAFRAGEVSLLVVLDAQRTANDAQLSYLRVLLDCVSAVARLEYLVPAATN